MNEIVIDQLAAALAKWSPRLRVVRSSFEVPAATTDRRVDALLDLEGGWRLAVEAIGEGYPRDVSAAADHLANLLPALPEGLVEPIPLVAARYMTEPSRALLRERGFGYFDSSSGSLHLQRGDLVIHVDRPAQKPVKRGRPVDPFLGAREQVVLALLLSDQAWTTGQELAATSNTSTFTVSTTLDELERQDWIESKGTGKFMQRRLARPGALLDAWSEAWRDRIAKGRVPQRRYYKFSNPVSKLMQWAAENLEVLGLADRTERLPWAFTGPAAANLVAPHLTAVNVVDIIVPPKALDLVETALELEPVDQGHNVAISERGGAALMARRRSPSPQLHDGWIANPFVLYLELQDGRGRNKELGQHLRETVLHI